MSPTSDIYATREINVVALDQHDRQTLVEVDARIADLQEALEAAARSSALDGDFLARLIATAEEAAARVNRELPVQIDSETQNEIRRRLIGLITAPEGEPALDRADRVLIEAEAVRHAIRDLLQEQPPMILRRTDEVIELIDEWLPGLTVKQRAALLGMSDRQLQRLRHEATPSSNRLQIVARLVAILRQAWTDQGVLAWFERPRRDLAGARPLDVLDEPARERDLLLAARAGRVQVGA